MKKILLLVFIFASALPLFSEEISKNVNWYDIFWEKNFFIEIEGHISNISDDPTRSILLGTAGYGGRLGYRVSDWGIHFHIEQNRWRPIEYKSGFDPGALNFGVGTNFLFFEGKMQFSFTFGFSYLLFNTLLDKRGEMGLYLDVRPIGFRFNIFTKRLFINFNPISFAFVNPVTGDIPIIMREYRTILALEFLL